MSIGRRRFMLAAAGAGLAAGCEAPPHGGKRDLILGGNAQRLPRL